MLQKQQQQSNHDNQRIIPTFTSALLQDKIFMLPMERKIRIRKKQKRKAIYYSTKYYDYEVCLSFWFSTTWNSILLSISTSKSHTAGLDGQWCNYCWCQCDHQRCFQRQCTKWWNSSQKRTHRNNFKYTCALHSMTIIWRNKITLLIDRSDFTSFFLLSKQVSADSLNFRFR